MEKAQRWLSLFAWSITLTQIVCQDIIVLLQIERGWAMPTRTELTRELLSDAEHLLDQGKGIHRTDRKSGIGDGNETQTLKQKHDSERDYGADDR